MDKKNQTKLEKKESGYRDDVSSLSSLGEYTSYHYSEPSSDILEAFPNLYVERDYLISFEYPEFTSLCPKTGQPDFGTIIINYVPDKLCVESKSFKLYMGAFRNHGSFMESLTNTIADDLIKVLSPRRIEVKGIFNVRGGTGIKVVVDEVDKSLSDKKKQELLSLW